MWFNLYCLPRIGRQIFRQSEKNCLSGPSITPSRFWSDSDFLPAFAHRRSSLGCTALDGTASVGGRFFARYPIPWNTRNRLWSVRRLKVFGTLIKLLAWPPVLRQNFTRMSTAHFDLSGVTICCALVESLPWKLDDNLTVPLAAGVLFRC
jgi:dolichol kinase